MRLPVVFREEAFADLIAARDWYDRQKMGLGDGFSARAEAVFDQLAETPELFAATWRNIRMCRLRKFPYVVYYRTLTHCVEILAVLHASRDPSVWQSRA